MKKRKGKLLIAILLAVLALGIGYAAITAIPLIINGTAKAKAQDTNFIVHFNDFTNNNYISYEELTGDTGTLDETVVSNKKVTGTFEGKDKNASVEIDSTDDTKATIKVENLENVGDSFTIKIPVINESDIVSANLSASIVNDNETYFNVTSTLDNDSILANGGATYVNVTVTLKKVPKVDDVSGTFKVTLTADPVEE